MTDARFRWVATIIAAVIVAAGGIMQVRIQSKVDHAIDLGNSAHKAAVQRGDNAIDEVSELKVELAELREQVKLLLSKNDTGEP